MTIIVTLAIKISFLYLNDIRMAAAGPQNINIIIVGDGAVGKTSIVSTFTSNYFPENHDITVVDNYSVQLTVQDKTYNLVISDTGNSHLFLILLIFISLFFIFPVIFLLICMRLSCNYLSLCICHQTHPLTLSRAFIYFLSLDFCLFSFQLYL